MSALVAATLALSAGATTLALAGARVVGAWSPLVVVANVRVHMLMWQQWLVSVVRVADIGGNGSRGQVHLSVDLVHAALSVVVVKKIFRQRSLRSMLGVLILSVGRGDQDASGQNGQGASQVSKAVVHFSDSCFASLRLCQLASCHGG